RRAAIHLGHALFVTARASDRRAHLAWHRHVFVGVVPGTPPAAADLSHRTARRHSLDRVWGVGHVRAGAARAKARTGGSRAVAGFSTLHGPADRPGHAVRRADSCGHDHAVHFIAGARGTETGAAHAARGRLCAWGNPVGGYSRGARLRPHGNRGGHHAGPRTRIGRDDGGDHGDREHAKNLHVALRAAVHDVSRDRERVHRGHR